MMTLLTILGALGGIGILGAGLSRAVKSYKRTRSSRTGAEKDYRYKEVEIAYRWIVNGQHCTSRRKAKLVALSDKLEGIRIGYGPASKTDINVEIVSGSVSIESIEPSPPYLDWEDYFVRFDQPLKKGEAISFELKTMLKAKSREYLNPEVSWSSTRQTDMLTLRSVFEGEPPSDVRFVVMEQGGDRHQVENKSIDPVNHEVKIDVPYPRPGLIYMLEWASSPV